MEKIGVDQGKAYFFKDAMKVGLSRLWLVLEPSETCFEYNFFANYIQLVLADYFDQFCWTYAEEFLVSDHLKKSVTNLIEKHVLFLINYSLN